MESTVIEKGSPWSYKNGECSPGSSTYGLKSTVTPKVIKEVGYLDPLDSFIEIVKDYCATLEEGLHFDSIMAYSGIGRPAITLNQVGENNNVTRERVRQVREIHIGRIRKLLKGFVIEGLVCDIEAIRQINLLRDKFFKYPLFVDSDVQDILISEGLSASGDRVHHLDLFFKVIGIECSNKLLFCVYCTRKIINFIEVWKIYSKVKKYLYKNTSPISLLDLSAKYEISCSKLSAILHIMPDVEEVEKHVYQIKSSMLCASDVAYRVLKMADKPIDYNELLATVNTLRGKNIGLIPLCGDNRFDNIGLTHMWTLKKSTDNKDYIYELIKKALVYYKKPCSPSKIYEYIQAIRPDIKEPQVSRIIYVYNRKKFLKLNNGEIILNSWKGIYSKMLVKSLPRAREQAIGRYNEALKEVLKGRAMSSADAAREISKITGLEEFGCRQRLYISKLVVMDKTQDPVMFSLIHDAEEIVNYNKLKTSKSVIESIINLFKQENKEELERRYVVNKIMGAHGVSIPQIYKLLRENDIFTIRCLSKVVSMVSLKKVA